jgi:phage-related protein
MANLVGKAMTGSTGALTKYGVTLTATQKALIQNGTQTQKASAVAQALEMNYGNLNKAMTKTAAGGAAMMQNQLAAFKVTVGNQLIPIQENLMSAISKILPVVLPVISSVIGGIGSLVQSTLPKLQSSVTSISSFIQTHMAQIKGSISAAGSIASTAANFFVQHWAAIKPILIGVVGALTLYKAAMIASNVVSGIGNTFMVAKLLISGETAAAQTALAAATGSTTVAQWLLNAAMSANPIGIVVVAVGALVAAFIYLWNTCKPFQTFMSGFFKAIVNGAINMVNSVISAINLLTSSILAPFNLILKGLNLIPGVKLPTLSLSIPKIPSFATGTNNFGGGAALVGEGGPELVTMPRGSAVHTASETKQMLGNAANGTSATQKGITINMTKLADQVIVRQESDIDKMTDKLATAFVTKLQKAYSAGMVPA